MSVVHRYQCDLYCAVKRKQSLRGQDRVTKIISDSCYTNLNYSNRNRFRLHTVHSIIVLNYSIKSNLFNNAISLLLMSTIWWSAIFSGFINITNQFLLWFKLIMIVFEKKKPSKKNPKTKKKTTIINTCFVL